MALSLYSLFNSTKDTYKLKIVAGEAGLNRIVSWPYYTEDSANAGFIRGGELVMTTCLKLERFVKNNGEDSENAKKFAVEYLTEFINALEQKNSSGLIINVGKYINTIPEEIIALCEKISFPLLVMPWEIHMIDIMQDYGNRIVGDRQKTLSTERALSEILFSADKFEWSKIENIRFFEAQKYSVILMEIPQEVQVQMKNMNFDEEQIRRYIEFFFNTKIDAPLSEFCFLLHAGKVIYVFREDTSDIQKALKSIRAVAEKDKFFKKSRISVSSSCSSPSMLEKEYRHAALALSFCPQNEKFCDYNSLGIYKILAEVEDKSLLEEIYEKILGEFDSFSKEKENDYLNTLKLYLEHNGKIQKTAEETAAHRNTVNYRIRKISERLGADLQDGKARYMIQTALYIREFLGKER